MSRFKELSNDKNTIVMRLLESKNICKALWYNVSDFFDQPDIDDPSKLVYKKIFPYNFIPETNSEQSTYITMGFGKFKLVGASFKSGLVRFRIFAHVDLHRTDYGLLRCDFIAGEIDKLINNERGIGIGKPQFHNMDELYVNNSYNGLIIDYKLYEWN